MSIPADATPKTLDAPELHEIAERIRARIRRTAMDIIETGQDLIQAKQALGHGKFGEWIEAEFNMSLRTAQNYMRAAEWAEGKSERLIRALQTAGLPA